jgi:hypothetical protein
MNFLASSGILLTVVLLAFGFGYYAKKNDLPLPPVVRGYIPDSGNTRNDHENIDSHVGEQHKNQVAVPDKYVLPVGATTNEFTYCLKSRVLPLIEGRDFRIEERSSLVRVLIPIAGEEIVSTGYEDCRSRFTHR